MENKEKLQPPSEKRKAKRKKENIIFIITALLFVYLFFIFALEKVPPFLFILTVIVLFSFIVLLCYIIDIISSRDLNNIRKKNIVKEQDETLHDYDSIVLKYFPEIKGEKELLDELYQRFVQVKEAESKGDLDSLKKLCGDSLSQSLIQQYKSYSKKEEKHIYKDFSLYAYNIQNIVLENNTISIQMFLHVAYKDYVTDLKGRVLRGDDEFLVHSQYLLDFVIDQDKKIICPNCGSHVSSSTCEYCNTVFKDVYYDFSLANIGLFKNKYY